MRDLNRPELHRATLDIIEMISIRFPKTKKDEVIGRLKDGSSWKHRRLIATTTHLF